jgi:hypothetical protein
MEVTTKVAPDGAFDLSPFSQSGLLEVRLHHDYVWRRMGVLCTEWEQTAASVFGETRVLCPLVDPILGVEL